MLVEPRTSLKLFDYELLKLKTQAPLSLSHVNTISMYGYRERDGTIEDGKTVAHFCDSIFELDFP